jgi:thiol-disulfide isomerase/thioredoxin
MNPSLPRQAAPADTASFRPRAAARRVLALLLFFLAFAPAATAGPPSTVTPVSLADFDTLVAQTQRGIVVAMASWCGPCKMELPHLAKLYREYRDKGLVLYGLSVDFAGAQAMQPLVNRFGVEFPVFWAGEAAVARYGLNPIPMLVFIQDGRTTARLQGAHTEEELRSLFEDFLAHRAP